jgi:Rrf2 family transcriptional regulator, iron-sulfur cluster assembly transcription factor
MRVTTWTEYSLIISLHLAKRGGTGGGPVAARELADLERLPADYVEQILLRLRRAGLVESVRGAKGTGRHLGPGRHERLRAPDLRDQLRDPPGRHRAM